MENTYLEILFYFGSTLRKVRKAKGLSQEALAVLSGLDRTYISGLERGRRNPTLKIIGQLAATLDVPITDLFRAED